MRYFRCSECRTRKQLFGDIKRHEQATGHALCPCKGYHYKHRPGSPCCERNPMAELNAAKRAGVFSPAELEEIALECRLFNPGKTSVDCPF